jgi:hypothetical protein
MTQVPMNACGQPNGQKAGPAMMDDVMEDAIPQESGHHARDEATGEVE